MKTSLDWAVVLAGGDGARLQPLTRLLSGDNRPKQFCRLLGTATLLSTTRSRLCQIVAPEHTLYVLNGQHRLFYKTELGELPPRHLVEQPANRGTAPAIMYALARVKQFDPDAVVGFFPADHHFEDVAAFEQVIAGAYRAAREDPARVVLIGTTPAYPESDYGWIVPGSQRGRSSAAAARAVFAVDSFVEKPQEPVARSLMASGSLWNTFIMVGRLRTFLSLLASAAPRLCADFRPLASSVGFLHESVTAAAVYSRTSPVDISRDVMSVQPDRLSVIAAPAMGWTDLGRADRVLALKRGA